MLYPALHRYALLVYAAYLLSLAAAFLALPVFGLVSRDVLAALAVCHLAAWVVFIHLIIDRAGGGRRLLAGFVISLLAGPMVFVSLVAVLGYG